VDEQLLNRILWHSIKGENVPMPAAPVRRALPFFGGLLRFPVAVDGDDDDDDRH
jgi:hypothetical protein